MTFDAITDDALQTALTTRWLGRQCKCFGALTSTQDVARRLCEAGALEGSTVVADEQTAGRGRQGRRWSSPAGLGIACSMILPRFANPGVAALVIGAGVAAGLSSAGVAGVALKWPNDVMGADDAEGSSPLSWPAGVAARARKIAGVLIEGVGGESGQYIAGVGVNVNQSPGGFPGDLAGLATSARALSGTRMERSNVLAAILAEIERRIDALRRGTHEDAAAQVEEWRTRSLLVGRLVKVESGSRMMEGCAVDIQPDGALVIERNRERTAVHTGTVRLAGVDA